MLPDRSPATNLRPILAPGGPRWAVAIRSPGLTWATAPWQVALVTAGTSVLSAAGLLYPSAPYVSAAVAGLFVPAVVWLYRSTARRVVVGPDWRYDGVGIAGDGLALLADIDSRFAFAERLIKEIPTGIDWHDVVDEVQVMLWEAAGQASRASALDEELSDLRYAAPGTPQMALRRDLETRRGEHLALIEDVRRDAEDLARVAGNALAASKVALAT